MVNNRNTSDFMKKGIYWAFVLRIL